MAWPGTALFSKKEKQLLATFVGASSALAGIDLTTLLVPGLGRFQPRVYPLVIRFFP
ncbi:hypothetical protein [Paraburkholderia silvatlantica]|uniref:hypothetical protein n=1 Tax=Paraburkholderia silvatlantica TaxID=321895 RepID=UPI001414EBEA|nr:hypothetical protein [Paraburkholderia silvatlantica]